MKRGKLVVLEGIDGCGKDTQLDLLMNVVMDNPKYGLVLKKSNVSSSPIGRAIREVLDNKSYFINDMQLTGLFISELFIVAKDIEELLEKGIDVVCSRWIYSTFAYTGSNPDCFSVINKMAKSIDLRPDLVIYLDLKPELAMERINNRNNRKDSYENLDRLINVHSIYKAIFNQDHDETKISIIDANKSIKEIHNEIINAIDEIGFCKTNEKIEKTKQEIVSDYFKLKIN